MNESTIHDHIKLIKPQCAHAFEAWRMADDVDRNFSGRFAGELGKLLDEYFSMQRKMEG